MSNWAYKGWIVASCVWFAFAVPGAIWSGWERRHILALTGYRETIIQTAFDLFEIPLILAFGMIVIAAVMEVITFVIRWAFKD